MAHCARKWASFLFACVSLAVPLETRGISLTIVHTNDLHSHLQGFGPELDYSPASTGDDATVGGIARVATLIGQVRESRGARVLVVDSGDFMMGSLFHTVSRQEGGELRLLGRLGYDAVTLGNHEFDLKPKGLAAILRSAAAKGPIPPIVAANVIFDPQSPEDDSLETAFRETGVQPYRVLERGGLKVGIFGIMGKRAAEVAPFARPVRFADPVEIARHTVGDLREKERVDLVVCLAHSGLTEEGEGEATTLARKVPGIDVMVSGHTHTILSKPVLAGKTWIVQAGSCGRNVGVLDLEVEGKDCRMIHYALIPVDDRIPGDSRVQADVEELRAKVEEQFLRPLGVTYQEPLAKISFPLTQEPWGESNLGDFVSDAIRWAMDRHEVRPDDPATRTRAAVQSNGVLRDPLLPGRRGILALCDLFRAIPLGFGPDGEMGYPLLAMYITAAEIRKALEVLTSVAPMRGTDYMLQISGIRFSYNPRRVPLDRVTEVLIQEASGEFVPLDTSSDNPALYKVGVNLYNAAFLKVIGRFTHGILTVIPKDRSGRPVQDLAEALLDKDPKAPGVQELKEWEALVAYLRHFPDRDGDGLPEIPEAYRSPQGRIMALPTWNPMLWFRNARWVTWAALGVVLAGFFVIGFSGWIVYRLVVRKSAGDR